MGWVQIIVTIVSMVIQRSAQKKAARKANAAREEMIREANLMAAQSRGVLLNAEANDSPLPVIYGRRRVGGVTCLKETNDSTNSTLHKVVALGEGPVQAIENVYFDNTVSTDDRFAGDVNALAPDGSTVQVPTAYVEKAIGTDTQAASTVLQYWLPSKWSSAHQGKGVAYLYAKLIWNDKSWQGEPTITADVRGRKLYDPRDGGTRFSNNPALVIRDYLTNTLYGRSIPEAAIDDTWFIASANYCDERVALPWRTEVCSVVAATDTLVFDEPTAFGLGDGVEFVGAVPGGVVSGSPQQKYFYIPLTETTGKLASSYANALAYVSGSPDYAVDITSGDGSPQFTLAHIDQARHQCDGVVDVEQTPYDNTNLLLTSCDGYLVFSGGKWQLKCDQVTAASGFVFTEDNIVGGWKIQKPGPQDKFNRVRASFFNPARQWQPDFAIYDNATYRTEDDGLILEAQLSLPYTANYYRAYRAAQLEARQSRLGIQVKFRATVAATQCEVGDVVEITHWFPGWTLKKFRIDDMELLPDDEVDIWASEYDDGAYSFTDADPVRTAPVTDLPNPFRGLDIAGLTASSGTSDLMLNGDGTVVPRVRLRWTTPTNPWLKEYELQIDRGSVSPTEWADCPKVQAGVEEAFAYPVKDGETVNLRIRAVTSLGNVGDWAYVYGHTVVGKTAAPSDVTSFSAQQQGVVIIFGAAEVSDVDLDLIEVRLADYGNTSWDDAAPVTNILRGQTVSSAAVMPGTWTFLAKARDTSGNYSATAARVDLTVTADGYATIAQQEQAPAWNGALTHMVRHWTGVLTPESQSLASALDWEVFDQFVPNAYTDCYFEAAVIDKGVDGSARVWADIVSVLGPGETTGTASPGLEIDTRTSSGSFDGFAAWTIGTDTFRYLKARIHVDTTVGKPVISGFEVNVDATTREETGTFTTGGGGSVAVTFATAFHSTPVVVVSPQGSGDVSASAASISGTGFTGYFKSGGAAAAGSASYRAVGA